MEEKALGRPKIMGDLEDLQKVSDGILEGSNASLDTFKEVGIALGNDPNFSTNITKQITVLSDRGFLSQEKFTNGRLIDYIKNIPLGKSISVYVGGQNVSHMPVDGGFFLMQIFRNPSTGDYHLQAQEFAGNNLTGNQWVADMWNFTDDKIPWKRVLTEDNGILKGLDNDLDNNRGIRLLKSDTQIEPTADMYSKGHMELRTFGAIPILGFHTQGKSACSLYEKTGRLHIIGNDGKGGQIATTDKIDNLPLMNGWVSEIFPATVARNGNSISIDAMIRLGSTANGASFFYLPEGFRPSKTRYFIGHTSYAKTPILIDVHPSGQVVPNSDQSVSNERVVINTTINI